MEENRVNRRSRPRPYDLRRKVLLKNFLREQMTYIPPNQLTPITSSNDSNFSEESSNSSEVDLQDLNDENNSRSSVSSENIQINLDPFANTSENLTPDSNKNDGNVNDLVNSQSQEEADAVVNESKIFKLTSLVNLKRKSKTNKMKGILKAKKICKTAKHPVSPKSVRSSIEKVFSKGSRTSKGKSVDETSKRSKSLFSLFKSRRELRKLQRNEHYKTSKDSEIVTDDTTKCSTSNQSVQTDESWSEKELSKIQQSNELLREENRLLSESLSYFMSSTTMDLHVNDRSNKHSRSSTQSFKNLQKFSDCYTDYSSSRSNNIRINSKSKIFRSKSVQEYGDRKTILRNNYRTRSMSSHNTQNNFLLSTPTASSSSPVVQPLGVNIPRLRKKNILASLPVNSTGRVVRRSSMPERIFSENDRSRICRRSDSIQNNSYRRPFSTLPSDAFF